AMAIAERQLRHEQELAGLDALETVVEHEPSLGSRAWASLWPKLLAIGIVLGGWQLLVMSGWKSEYILPSPFTVLERLWTDMGTSEFWLAISVTMQRAVKGYALALVIGVTLGLAVSRSRVLRAGVGSLITGLQTMPSVAWFPLAILLFKLTDAAIMFVIVLGAAPSIANGLIHGVDHVPPIMLRAGRVLGAKGFSSYRHVILPAALPSFTAGLKQGWAFSWRSLMAGELLVVIAKSKSLGFLLASNRDLLDAPGLMATMIVILVIGIMVDALFFAQIEKRLRHRWGLDQK
ncbi:MAG TPA: ABC transporter permease, partial [Acidimicrobiales bacterium]